MCHVQGIQAKLDLFLVVWNIATVRSTNQDSLPALDWSKTTVSDEVRKTFIGIEMDWYPPNQLGIPLKTVPPIDSDVPPKGMGIAAKLTGSS